MKSEEERRQNDEAMQSENFNIFFGAWQKPKLLLADLSELYTSGIFIFCSVNPL